MQIGFDTIGNATVIAYDDGRPVLATDPWVQGSAYFGSWKLSHEVPPEQLQAIREAEYVWFSHGHPDHLNADSLPLLAGKKLLLPDHVGGRIKADLEAQGFLTHVLPDRTWVELSRRVRVCCVADYNQDAILLLDVNGTLVFDMNDAGDRGWGSFVRDTIKLYKRSFLLALAGYGDADMLNYFDETGERLPLPPKGNLGPTIAARADAWGTRYCIPFSAMHRFQRTDSAWASCQTPQLSEWSKGWNAQRCEILPPFVRVDCAGEDLVELHPKETAKVLQDPSAFGDDWSEPLEDADVALLDRYFLRIAQLHAVLDFVKFRVGGREHTIVFNQGKFRRGILFEAPRGSLMTAVKYEVFDDLLIGNFMRVTLLGRWPATRLYPDFSPYVAKYADNGRAHTRNELDAYFAAYRARDAMGYLRHQFDAHCLRPLQSAASNLLRESFGPDTAVFKAAKHTYRLVWRG